MTQLLGGKDDGLKQRPTRVTFGGWTEEWLEKWCVEGADRTRNDYRAIFERYLWPDKLNHLHPDKAARVTAPEQNGRKRRTPRSSARTDDRLTMIAKQLRAKKLRALTTGDIQDFANALREYGLAPRTRSATVGVSSRATNR